MIYRRHWSGIQHLGWISFSLVRGFEGIFCSPKGQSRGGRTNDSGSSTKLYHTTGQSLQAVGLGCERYEIGRGDSRAGVGSQMRPEAAQTNVGDGYLRVEGERKEDAARVEQQEQRELPLEPFSFFLQTKPP